MRKASIQLLATLLLFLILASSWGDAASSVSQPNVTQQAYLPLVMKPEAGLTVPLVKVIQGSSLSESYAVYIADRETMVRVFVGTTSGESVPDVTGRLCGYNSSGQSLGCIEADNGAITAPSEEDVLNSTLNFKLPMSWVKPGFSYHVDVNPVDLNSDSTTTSARFPETDTQSFNFVTAPDLQIVVVPIKYRPYQSSQSFLPKTSDISYLTELPIKVFPVPEIDYHDHALFTYAPTESEENLDQIQGWIELLIDLTALHAMEDPADTKNYYGLVNIYDAHGCNGGCITGIAWLGETGGNKTAAGWSGFGAGTSSASETMVHEMGHNFNRKHVVCTGKESNPDGDYPYSNGAIGQFGLDLSRNLLFQPDIYSDYMSYCDPTWTSDYTYWNVYQYRQQTEMSATLNGEAAEALYVSGVISPDAEVTLRPVYSQRTRVPLYGVGSHTLQLLDSSGREVAAYPFTPVQIADSGGYSGFGLFVPARGDFGGLRVLEGSEVKVEKLAQDRPVMVNADRGLVTVDRSGDGMQLHWESPEDQDVVYRIRLSQDGGQTWQVLALDWSGEEFPLPAGVIDGLLEIQASDGLRTHTTVLNLP